MKEKLKMILEFRDSENTLTDFLIKTHKIYEVFGYEFKLNPKEIKEDRFVGAKVWLNEQFTNAMIHNIDIVFLNMVYPKIMSKVINTNAEHFNEVYSKLIEIYKEDKFNALKNYINMVYGCLGNPKCDIYSNNIHLVPEILNKILSNILSEFSEYIIYIDTDEIYFRKFDEIKDRFEEYFNSENKYDLTYSIEKSKFGLFMKKKKFFIEQQGEIKMKGIRYFNDIGESRGGTIKR